MFGPTFRKKILIIIWCIYYSKYIPLSSHSRWVVVGYKRREEVMNSMEILQRHKEAKDAGIITNVEFMKIYNDIIVNGVGGSGNNTSNSSSTSSSHHTPQPPSPPELNNKNKRKRERNTYPNAIVDAPVPVRIIYIYYQFYLTPWPLNNWLLFLQL